MKQTVKMVGVFCLLAMLCLSFAACRKTETVTDLWSNATYTENTELGEGAKTLTVDVVAQDKTVTFTLHSDAKTVGEALLEHKLIAGEMGAYGMYVKVVNGITADYDKDQSFWSFTKNGESMMTGVDGAEFSDGDQYELIYTK